MAMIAITTSSSISVTPRRSSIVGDGIMADSSFLVQSRQVPDLDRMIAASRDQAPAIGAERHAGHEAGVAAEVADQLTGVAVPDFHGAVLTPRRDPAAIVVRAESHGVDVPVVSLKGPTRLAVLHVPDLDRVRLTPGRQPPAVRAEGHTQTRTGDPRANGGDTRFRLPV